LASRNPNLQNLKRDGFVKEAFVSRWGDEGILLEADYKQLELFVMAIVSQDPKFVHAFLNDIDLHTKVAANIVFRCSEEKVTKQMRTATKPVNFGVIYGKTAYSLKDDLNVSEEEAQRILDGYHEEYNGVKAYKDRIISQARADGYVTTVMGRRRYLDYSDPNGADRQAVNTTIQSPASDVCVTAVNQQQEYFAKIARELTRKIIQDIVNSNQYTKEEAAIVCGTVHDSIIVDSKKKYVNEIAQAVKLIMENTGLEWITIPLKVDIKYGPNLRNMMEWDSESRIEV
jgi:DNA polymerase-1